MQKILSFWREYIATLLIFVLLLSQTIRVDFFLGVSASQETYRDVVSIFVDRDTYRGSRAKILRYADDIQRHLGSTRTSIFVVDRGVSPAYIAAENERLYYTGQRESGIVSYLVGTILIGDIPIPMVDTGSDQFPSVYPYVDFVDKKFVYDEDRGVYRVSANGDQRVVEPEIWHGVINPAVGRDFQDRFIAADPTLSGALDILSDIEKIDTFLDKTHQFYMRSGVFSPSNIPPRVFYYDGFYESKSFAIEDLGLYALSMEHAEAIIYNRFSKHFFRYLLGAVEEARQRYSGDSLRYMDSIGLPGTTGTIFDDAQIDTTPDILTKTMSLELLKNFHQLINQKTLGDIRGFVRNAGRYNNGSETRVDQPAINISLMDYAASNVLRKVNDKIEEYIDTNEIQGGVNLWPFDDLTIREPGALGSQTRIYGNYLFGREVVGIYDPHDCNLTRGSDYIGGPYKQGILVEANKAFDVYSTPDSMQLFESDGRRGINCAPLATEMSSYETDTYWGKNIITNVNTSNWTFNEPSWLTDFYQPIFSLGGMREINQEGNPVIHDGPTLGPANPEICFPNRFTYMLQQGFTDPNTGRAWPDDIGRSGDEISCLTEQEVTFSQPTWGGSPVPPVRWVGQELNGHYASMGDNSCEFGQVAMYNEMRDEGTLHIPRNTWACIPSTVISACEGLVLEKGQTLYECLFPRLSSWIQEINEGGVVAGRCPANPREGVLYSTPCPIRAFEQNAKEEYWSKIPDGASFQSPCMVGHGRFNGAAFANVFNPCVRVGFSSGSTDGDGSEFDTTPSPTPEVRTRDDFTTWENQSFHSTRGSMVFHKSPTDEEITIAESTNATPSLAIDHDRYVRFHEMGPSVTFRSIYYPNLFRFDDQEILAGSENQRQIVPNLNSPIGQARLSRYGSGAILVTAYRIELDRLGNIAWEGAAATDEFSPPEPPCWGGYLVGNGCVGDGPLSDEDIVAAIQAKRWLHADVTLKMKQAVETGLSFAREYGSGGVVDPTGLSQESFRDIPLLLSTITGTLSSPPKIPTLTGSYDIAYLGLTHFIPEGDDAADSQVFSADGTTFSEGIGQYTETRRQIAAMNISEQDREESISIDPAPSDNCGPPEGVDLFEWPSAIMCWMRSLTPVRLVGYACGVNTVGIDGGIFADVVGSAGLPRGISGLVQPAPLDINRTIDSIVEYYRGSQLIYSLERDVMLPRESGELRFFLSRDNSLLATPQNSNIRIEVQSIRTVDGTNVPLSRSQDFLSWSPVQTPMSNGSAMIALRSTGQIGTVTLRGILDIISLDGQVSSLRSSPLSITISDEYIVPITRVGDDITSRIPVTSMTGMVFDFSVRTLSGASRDVIYPIRMDIWDDIDRSLVASGIVIQSSPYSLPTEYTRTVGVYRMEIRDNGGRRATQTIVVEPGALARASFSPVSSALLAGSNTLVSLRLRDALGNPIAPNLHSVVLTAEGGYFVMASGEKRPSITLDTLESEVSLTVGSDREGTIILRANIDETVTTSSELRVFENARVVISRGGVPVVGGADIPVVIRILDTNGNPISGFRSLISLGITSGGGSFDPRVAMIENGVSQALRFSPGRLAGNHRLTVSIPGIGTVSDIGFSVSPGVGMYIGYIEREDDVVFSIRDRYNNIVPTNPPGTLRIGGDPVIPIAFSGGIYSAPKVSGWMTVEVPSLVSNSISYTDANETFTIRGIPFVIARINSLSVPFDFTEDYNARYTVLAGGSFLRESEDILYNTILGSGQSLAVTTLLDTPYKRENILSIYPGGGIQLYSESESLPESSLSLIGGYPQVSIQDRVTNALITQLLYRPLRPVLTQCEDSDCLRQSSANQSSISLGAVFTGYTTQSDRDGLRLLRDTNTVLNIDMLGRISVNPGVRLEIEEALSKNSLIIGVYAFRERVGVLRYATNRDEDIYILDDIGSIPGTGSTVFASNMLGWHHDRVSHYRLNDTVSGLRFYKKPARPIYDEQKNGPESIDGIGATIDTPGIGWKGTNRMLLSFAGGDTVGEASRWFHTYTLINLGDPVAHVDGGAPGTLLDGVDRTIGKQLTSSRSSPVQRFVQRDMDGDGYEDIVVQKVDGYIELLHNLGDRIRSRGNIAYVPDLIQRGFSVGDFSQDGYADLIGLDERGVFVLLDNQQRRFARMRLSLASGVAPPTGVSQFKVYDMDRDGRDDIVYLTEGGELSILYATATAGTFDRVVLDATLGLTLSEAEIRTGGAIYADRIPQVSLDASRGDGLDPAIIWNEVYVPYRDTPSSLDRDYDLSQPGSVTGLSGYYSSALGSPSASQSSRVRNFIKSEYAPAQDINISKRYSLGQSVYLTAGERIRVTIDIQNRGTTPLRGVEYLDTIPHIFDPEDTINYSVDIARSAVTRDFALSSFSEYDAYFTLPDIPAGETARISYELTARPMSFGEILVGDFEQGESGQDVYGDVAFSTETTCGADMILWRSTASRSYERGTRSFSDPVMPSSITDRIRDTDGDGIPDSIQDMDRDGQQAILDSLRSTPGSRPSPSNATTSSYTAGTDPDSLSEIVGKLDDIYSQLAGCSGGGGCMNFPINWAPLAPGGDPVAFGYPIGDGFRVGEGLPLFSSMTRIDIDTTFGCYTIPVVWPLSPQRLDWPGCSSAFTAQAWASAAATIGSLGATPAAPIISAGGMLGITSPANTLRIFVTPTLTLGVGAAICYGGPAGSVGYVPPPGAWPATPGGNCLVVAKPMNMCRNDGSVFDADIRNTVGLGSVIDAWNAGNGSAAPSSQAGTCSMIARTQSDVENRQFTNNIISYIRSPDESRLPTLYQEISRRVPSSQAQSTGPLLSLRGASPDGALMSVDVDVDLAAAVTGGDIIKLKNKRIAAFPDFIMDWVSRQTDELVNAFFTPPSLIIIPPTTIGQNTQFDGTLSGFTDTFKSSFEQASLENIQTKMGQAYDAEVRARGASTSTIDRTRPSNNNATSDIGRWMQDVQTSFDSVQDEVFRGELGRIADQGKGGLASVRAAYNLVGKLPLVSIQEKNVPIDVPWIMPQELDKYARALDAYARELQYTLDNFCINDPSPACIEERSRINISPLLNSVEHNLRMIEEYKNFPAKLQKYITWKQRYLSQILCYIEEIQQMSTGWLKDNSIRFRKWAELWVLLRTIADSWQPIIDILMKKDAYCAVCHNERYNAKYWKYKIISMLIPSIPVIQMPRWPDIVLDLSDVRLGIVIAMPNFQFNLKPIRLPDIPNVSLPRTPGINILGIDLLPPIPELPDLPDLPAIPVIKLPNLPPPPKLPKILSELEVVVDILKLWSLYECYVNKTPFVPEWTVGDVIAQRTERQGTNFLDFIDISLPQISIPTIKEIRVSSHVNFEVRSEFITEYAQGAVAPLNQFNADLGRGMPRQVGTDINISTPQDIDIRIQSSIDSGVIESLSGRIARMEQEKDILLDTGEFADILEQELLSVPELAHIATSLRNNILKSQKQADDETQGILAYNNQKYDLLRSYVQTQYDETGYMQNIVDLLTDTTHENILSGDIERVLMVSDQAGKIQSRTLRDKLNTHASSMIDTSSDDQYHSDTALQNSLRSLQNRLGRIAGNVGAPTANTTIAAASMATGYSPNFQGIYIITERGNQTRLFDYTAPLQKQDKVIKTDIDRDGDQDYLFVFEGTLFLKSTQVSTPRKIVDTRTTIVDRPEISMRPTAPDYFRESVSLPNMLTFGFESPADTATIWRAEFYDRYMEWDILRRGDHDASTTPLHVVETFRRDRNIGYGERPVYRSIVRIDDRSTFVLEGPRMEILSSPREFSLSPGRVLYTGERGATIRHTPAGSTVSTEMRIQPHRGYSFSELMDISLLQGTLYITFPTLVPERYEYSENMIGMPVLPGMRLYAPQGQVIIRNHIGRDDIILPAGSYYRSERLTQLGREYGLQTQYQNGFYYPMIRAVNIPDAHAAGVGLFSPQLSSDTSAPDILLRDTIRIPVYQTREFLLRDIISETNTYTVSLDVDTSQDANGNGIYDDDFVTSAPGLTITDASMRFGPFDRVGRYNMMMRVEDEYYNITIRPITVEVYAPIANIDNSDTERLILSGSLSESLSDTPIHVFRVRPGSDIVRITSGSILTDSLGGFTSEFLSNRDTGIRLTTPRGDIFLDENGIPTGTGYTTQVTLATSDSPLFINLVGPDGIVMYRQALILPENTRILEGTGSMDHSANTLYIQPSMGYRIVSAQVNDPNIPGGVYIVNNDNRGVVAIARDGNIYPLDTTITARFSHQDGYPMIILSRTNSDIAQLLYQFDFFYTMN